MTVPHHLPYPPAPPLARPTRWWSALDALAPHAIVIVALIVARQPLPSTRPANVAAIAAIIVLGIGTGIGFFRDMSESHVTWPAAFAVSVVLLPLLALHARFERAALAAPVPIHLLPLAFTWTALLAVTALLIGIIYTMAAHQPGWAGIIVAPIALLVGALPVLSANLSETSLLTAALVVFVSAEVALGIVLLLPERYRWFLILFILTVGAFTIGRAFETTFHHFPGRFLFVGDAALALLLGLIALASPLICHWLGGSNERMVGGRR